MIKKIIKKLKNKFKSIRPIDAVVAVTYKCNSRCTMCDIWKISEHNDIDTEMYKKLPKSLRFVNISGGEPFLRPDIVEVVKTVHERCPKAYIIISSNGFATNLIIDRMKKIKEFMGDKIGVGLSVDGMQEMHDKVRRIPNGFNKIMDTLDKLKGIGVNDIRLAFTISDENIMDLNKVYDLTQEKDVDFTMAYAQSSENYFGGKENEFSIDPKVFKQEMDKLIQKQIKGWNIKKWLRAFFTHGVYLFATKQKQPLPVVSGTKHFFLDPSGVVYPSVVHNKPMGNIKDYKFAQIWYNKDTDKVRQEVSKASQRVWMICTARTAILKHPFHVMKWILKTKFSK